MKTAFIYETRIGSLLIAEDGQGITDLMTIREEDRESLALKYAFAETDRLREAAAQLAEYLEGSRKEFTLPLNPQGTPFQRKVWEALRKIPYGETRSYKQIAKEIGNEKACRAVGMANNRNPILCVIPCHRVIGANGSLVGYAGGLDLKKQLLQLEKGKEEAYEL